MNNVALNNLVRDRFGIDSVPFRLERCFLRKNRETRVDGLFEVFYVSHNESLSLSNLSLKVVMCPSHRIHRYQIYPFGTKVTVITFSSQELDKAKK